MPLVLSRRVKPSKTTFVNIRKAENDGEKAVDAFGNALERAAQKRAFQKEEEALIVILNQAYKQLGAAMDADDIRDTILSALSGGQLQPILDALNWVDFAKKLNEIAPIIQAGNSSAAAAQLKKFFNVPAMSPTSQATFDRMVASATKPVTNFTIHTLFNLTDQNAIDWARTESSQLIVNIQAEVRSNIQTLVGNAMSGQYNSQQLAHQIAQIIPLHTQWANAVVTRQQNLLDTFLKNGMSLTDAQEKSQSMSDAYAARLTRTRAMTIARTESAMAAGQGRMNAWNTLITQGILAPDAQKIWLTAEDEVVCPICEPLDQQTAGINDEFAFGGLTIPAHPSCRCDVALLPTDISGDTPQFNETQDGPVVQADQLIDDSQTDEVDN